MNLTKENKIPAFEKIVSISLSSHGFSFSVKDSKQNLLQIADYTFHLPESMMEQMNLFRTIFAENNMTTFGFKEINIIYPTAKQVWVPNHLFNTENTKDYLSFVAPLTSKEKVLDCHISELNAHAVFAMPETLYSSFKVLMPTGKFYSQQAALFQKAYPLPDKEKATVFVNTRKNEIDVLVFEKGKLLLTNTFSYKTDISEILYAVLNVLKQLQIETETSVCYLSGFANDVLLEHFRTFIPHSYFTPQHTLDQEFNSLPAQQHFILL